MQEGIQKVQEQEEKLAAKNSKQLSKAGLFIFRSLAFLLVAFHIYTALQGDFLAQTSIHFLFVLTLLFFLYPFQKDDGKLTRKVMDKVDIALAIIALSVNIYYIYHAERIIIELGYLTPTTLDLIFGSVTILLILEGARRAVGIVFPILAIIAIAYALFGNHLQGVPGLSVFSHSGYSFNRFVIEMFMGQQGIYQGSLLPIGATTIAIFIIFGAMLVLSGGGETFIRLAIAIAGKLKGGPAKVALLSSALFGSINGSTAANAATTGVFTIPLMKRNGYKPHFSGAVEAAASCGGQILPPIMGAAAFVLAEVTGTNYIIVAAAALIPAVLYYFGLWMAVHFEAKRLDLNPVEKADLPKIREVLLSPQSPALFIPLFVLIALLIIGYTPAYSAVWAVLTSIILYFIQKVFQKDLKQAVTDFFAACGDGAKTIAMIGVILAAAQMIATVISMTGVGNLISNVVIGMGEASVIITLVLGMIVTIIMGMGVPTVAAYMLSASVIYPAFAALGFPALSSHLFILYFAILSGITPPVSLAAYVTASIAGSHWFRTAITACKIGLAGFLIPYMFIFNPVLLGQGEWYMVVIAVTLALIGIISLAGSTIGYWVTHVNWAERVVLFAVALLLLHPEIVTGIIGISLFIIMYSVQKWKEKKRDNSIVKSNVEAAQ